MDKKICEECGVKTEAHHSFIDEDKQKFVLVCESCIANGLRLAISKVHPKMAVNVNIVLESSDV